MVTGREGLGGPRPICRWLLGLLAGLLLPAAGAWAAERELDLGREAAPAIVLAEYLAVLEDPSQALTLDDVRAAPGAQRFTSAVASGAALSFGFTRSAWWLRLSLRNTSDRVVTRWLVVGYPILSELAFHARSDDGSASTIHTGVATPFSTRPLANRAFVFPVLLPAHSAQVVHLRVRSASALLIPALLWDPQAFQAHAMEDQAIQAWYFGMASALILFNLLLLVALRDPTYLLYAAFALGTALTVAAGNGWGKQFLWPQTTRWSDIAISVLGALSFAALLLFMRRLLGTREGLPRADLVIRIAVVAQLLFAAGVAVSPQAFAVPGTLLVTATGLLVLAVGLYGAIVQRQRLAALFLAAYTAWIGGVALAGLKTLTLLPANAVTMNGHQIGSVLEMLLLAFALAYRFHLIRRQATEDVRQANASLAQRLQAREAELTASHERLREIEYRQALSEERQRLMQDMHDGLGSSLTTALRVAERGQLQEADLADVLKGCIDDLKLAIDSLEPVDADLLLLLATLRYRLEPRLEGTGIRLLWEVQDVPRLPWLDPRHALHILRIAQEAISNVIRHAQATQIRVATGAGADSVWLSITDNGTGFDPASPARAGGKGLANQKRRAQAIGAQVEWASDGQGTCVTLRLPIAAPRGGDRAAATV